MVLKDIVWYLAGKMSGIPQFNFPLFDKVTTTLRERGWKVVSPAELDEPEVREQALASEYGDPQNERDQLHDMTWGDFLSRDVKIVADEVGGVILLPGWEGSRGARLEAFVGILCKHKFKEVDPDFDCTLYDVSDEYVEDKIIKGERK